jgi:ABC-type branched-subunit amino acid transport system substrate-binding protein
MEFGKESSITDPEAGNGNEFPVSAIEAPPPQFLKKCFWENEMKIALMLALALVFLAPQNSFAQKKYDPGAGDSEVKIGNTAPYSGLVSAAGVIGKASTAYFSMLNSKGGINGRKVTYISLDDGYSPPKTVEQTRKLVEQENVLFMSIQVGTPTSASVQRYLNTRKVPQLLVASGSSMWNKPKQYPWSTPFPLSGEIEMGVFAKHILEQIANPRIAVLYQNDDFGKDYLRSFKNGLGEKNLSLIVKEVSYETSDPTIDTQIVALQASGANVFLDISTPKFGAQSIRKVFELGWRTTHFVTSSTTSIEGTLKPAGFDRSQGVVTATIWKSLSDPSSKNDAGVTDYLAFMKAWYPEADPTDLFAMVGYTASGLVAQILHESGDELTRENVLKKATSLKDIQLPLVRSGILVNNSPSDYGLFSQVQLVRFEGSGWEQFGELKQYTR